MADGFKTGGREKGTPNRITSNAKARINAVFEHLGGIDKMAEWAKNNETEFYKIYARLIPSEVELSGQVTVTERVSIVAAFLAVEAAAGAIGDSKIVGEVGSLLPASLPAAEDRH